MYIQAGAGIVADSVVKVNLRRQLTKAGALVKALSTALDIRDN